MRKVMWLEPTFELGIFAACIWVVMLSQPPSAFAIGIAASPLIGLALDMLPSWVAKVLGF